MLSQGLLRDEPKGHFYGQSYRGIHGKRGCAAPEMPQLKRVPIASCFKGLTCLFLSIMVEVTAHSRLKNDPGMRKTYFVN